MKIRYKEPDQDQSILSEYIVRDLDESFAAAVAAFGMVLRDSPHKGSATLGNVLEMAQAGQGVDRSGYRREFIQLVQRAASMIRQDTQPPKHACTVRRG